MRDSFFNQQPGSGAHGLFDYKLDQLGISPESIKDYDHEEFTHMAVAVDVLTGAVDCGLGILAADKALDLDFISIEKEQYDLIIPCTMLELPDIQAVLEVIRFRHSREKGAVAGWL